MMREGVGPSTAYFVDIALHIYIFTEIVNGFIFFDIDRSHVVRCAWRLDPGDAKSIEVAAS